MQYLVVVAPGDDITSFPNGEFAIRASSYMTAARGTLTSGSDPNASSGEYVADAQQIPLSEFATWTSIGPYTDEALKDYTLEIPLQDLVDAGMRPNPVIYALYGSLQWPGEPAGDGLRDGSFWQHSSWIQRAYATAVSPMVISSGGEDIYDSYRTHYSMKRLAAAIRYFTGPGEDPIADGRLRITLVSRETEIGTIVPRIDQLVLIPFDSAANPDGDDWLSSDPEADRVEAGLLYDDALNGTFSADDQIISTAQVMDYQEATGSGGAEFTGGVVHWSGGASLPYEKVWMIAGISNRDEGVVADDTFGRSTGFGGSWAQVLGATESGAMYWSENSRQGGSSENNINGLGGTGQGGYYLDGSKLVDLQVSSYFELFGDFTASDLYAAIGLSVAGTDVGYNAGRTRARVWSDARDWDIKCRVTWDKVPQTTFQNGLMLANFFNVGLNAFALLSGSISWCVEQDETGDTFARLRLFHPGSSLGGYPSTTFPPDDPPPFGGPDAPDNNWLNVLSEVIGEVGVTHSIGDWIWLRLRRRAYRLSGKVWLDGSTEPGSWDVDEFVLRGEEDGLSNLYIIDYPYIPTAGRDLKQSRFQVDFPYPGITSFVETWNSYMWEAYSAAATACTDPFWQHVGWPQNVCDFLTSSVDDFEVSYPNDGSADPVDCNIRCYNLDDQPITGSCVLPKGAQYIGYVGRIEYSNFDAGTGTEGPLFKYKAWNNPGAPPLQGVLTRLPRGLRVGPPVIGIIKGGPKLYAVV